MALEDTSVIDLMAKPDAAGKVCLIITDAGLTTDPELRFELLTQKLQAYVRAVLSGELEVEYPEKPPSDFFIRVVCAHPPTEAMRQITSVGEFDGQIPVRFETWQPEDESNSAVPVAAEIPPAIESSPRPLATPPPLPVAVQPQRSSWLWPVMGLGLLVLGVAVLVGFWFVRAHRAQSEPASVNEAATRGANGSNPSTGTNSGAAALAEGVVNDDLVIRSAEFGVGSRRANVKARVTELLRTQPEGFEVSHKTLQRDPVPGKPKVLTIQYRYQGADYTVRIQSWQILSVKTLASRATK